MNKNIRINTFLCICVSGSISADIKLETENDDDTGNDDLPVECCLSKNIYHPRMALKYNIKLLIIYAEKIIAFILILEMLLTNGYPNFS